MANLKSISHRCHPILVAFVWELTEETIDLPLGCLQGGRREVPWTGRCCCCMGAMSCGALGGDIVRGGAGPAHGCLVAAM